MAQKTELVFQKDTLQKAQLILRAINNTVRQKIMKFIHEQGSTEVNAIYNNLGMEQSIVSQHLRTLRDAGMVSVVPDGKRRIYSVDEAYVAKVQKTAELLF